MESIKTDICPNRQQISERFLLTKPIPPSLWNAFDYLLQFSFKIKHIAGSVSTATGFLSRLEVKVMEKFRLKIREEVQTTPIEFTTSSSIIADEENFFFAQTECEDWTKDQTLEWEEQSGKNSTYWVANEEPSSMKPSFKEFTKIVGNTTSYYINGIKAKKRILVEQDDDFFLRNLKIKLLGQTHDKVLQTTDRQFKHYEAKEHRIIVKDGLFFRKYY